MKAKLQRMYMLTEEMVYQKVHSDGGIFTYEPMHAEVNNFSRGSYSAFSFSNHFFLAKKVSPFIGCREKS